MKQGQILTSNYHFRVHTTKSFDEADNATVYMPVDCHFMTHGPKIPSQNGVQKPMSAKILQLLILLTLISTI